MENENLFQNNSNVANDINEGNLFFKIWLKPKETLTYILSNCPDRFVLLLFALGGISRSIDRAASKGMGDTVSTISILSIAIIAGGLFGWMYYFFYAWLLEATGKWLKGTASYSQFKTILAWSMIPAISSLILLIPELLIFGEDVFKSELSNPNGITDGIFMLFGLLEITLGIWTLVIFIKGVCLIQNFSVGKAILNSILPALLIVIPIVLIALLFRAFF